MDDPSSLHSLNFWALATVLAFFAAEPALVSAQEPSTEDVLENAVRPALDQTLAGWTRASMKGFDDPLGVEATYTNEARPYTIGLGVGFGGRSQRQFKSMLETWRNTPSVTLTETQHRGRALQVIQSPRRPPLGVALFKGDVSLYMIVCGESQSCTIPDTSTARQDLFSLLDALDLDALAAAVPARLTGPNINVPEGFSAYNTALGDVQVAVPYPDDWHLIDLHERTRFLKALALVREAEAAQELFGPEATLSTNDEARLGTSTNITISLSVVGRGPGPTAFLEQGAATQGLDNTEVVQEPTPITIADHEGLEMTVRGTDADGHPVLRRRIAFTAGDQLLDVSILRPAETADNAMEAETVFLNRLKVRVP